MVMFATAVTYEVSKTSDLRIFGVKKSCEL